MEYKTIKTKKATSSMTQLVMFMLLVMGIFSTFYYYIQYVGNENDVSLNNNNFTQSFDQLSERQTELDTNVNSVKDNLNSISEADDVFQVAWNGLKGVGNTLKAMVSFVSVGVDTYTSLTQESSLIPNWIKSLLLIGIIALIVFLVLALLKGEPRL